MIGNFLTGIYKITNKENGKIYIGKSHNITRRWHEHTKHLSTGTHHSSKLQTDWDTYGVESFSFEVINICNDDMLATNEAMYISQYDSINKGYNMPGTIDNTSLEKSREIRSKYVVDIDKLLKTGIDDDTLFRFMYIYTKTVGENGEIRKPLNLTKLNQLYKFMKMKDRLFRMFKSEILELGLVREDAEGNVVFNNDYIYKLKALNTNISQGQIIIYKESIDDIYNSVTLNDHKCVGRIFKVSNILNNNKFYHNQINNGIYSMDYKTSKRDVCKWSSIDIRNGSMIIEVGKNEYMLNPYLYHKVDDIQNLTKIKNLFINVEV